MRPVRSITVTLLVCLSLAGRAIADEADAVLPRDVGVVQLVLAESVETHGHQRDITRICRSGHGVRGCTDFPVERLECACVRHGDHWLIDARAEIGAVIHLSDRFSDGRILAHERMHIEDLRAALLEHLERIASRPYQSESACAIYARVLTESPHLRVVMNNLRVKSNEKYGCSRHSAF